MNYIQDVLLLFFPKICITCESKLLQSEKLICTLCRHDLPIICYKDYKNNKITKAFYGRIPIEKANAFLFYRKDGKTKNLIHALKYKGNQKVENFIGDWFGSILKDSNEFTDIDCIISVPLHPKKQKKRGYNQLTTFGLRLSKYLDDILIRNSASKTQTFKQRLERFSNNSTKLVGIKNTFFNEEINIKKGRYFIFLFFQ